MDAQTIASQVVDAVKATPERAQELISDPRGAIESITGATGFDVTEVLQASLAKLSDAGLDLSSVDLSKLNLSEIDVTKLDLVELQETVSKLGIDASRLDLGAIAGKLFGGASGLLGGLGGLFGRR